MYNTSGSYSIISLTSENVPSTVFPTTSEIEAAVDLGLYGFSGYQWVLPDDSVPFAYRYLRNNNAAYWQVTDPDRVWSITKANSLINVENPDFVFAKGLAIGLSAGFMLSSLNLF